MKRLASEGLLREAGQERQGNRPTRQLYEITEAGRIALEELRLSGLTDIWFKYDPFDLALTKADSKDLGSFTARLGDRLERLKAMLDERRDMVEAAIPYIGLIEEWALRHTERRLVAEIDFLTDLIASAPAISDDQHNPRPRKEKLLVASKGRQSYIKQA